MSTLALFRVSLYLRRLAELEQEGVEKTSSRELGERFSISAASVRKDLGFFGAFGRAGIGYEVHGLRESLMGILGLERTWKVAIVGAGRLGRALAKHKGLAESKFEISALLDKFPDKTLGEGELKLEILHIDVLPEVAHERDIEIGIIAVPGPDAQDAANSIVAAGLKAILNFAPARIKVPPGVFVHNVDFTIYLENLAYFVNRVYHQGQTDIDGSGLD
ncbi:MAG: redox-sensing transcriptional repressor Rex [Candidatus Coatesbacteria bacterium]|nr:redox-sensing transcriptional repressor Rex [Candidatus Coatesbacteria bacterium]